MYIFNKNMTDDDRKVLNGIFAETAFEISCLLVNYNSVCYNDVSGAVLSAPTDCFKNDWNASNTTISAQNPCSIFNIAAGLKVYSENDTTIYNDPYSSFAPTVDRSGWARFYLGTGNDYIKNQNSSDSEIIALGGNNTIDNFASNRVLIVTGSGEDSVKNWYTTYGDPLGKNVIIQTGAGNDTINNSGDYSSIDAGEDDDRINNNGNNVTISGGSGDDSIKNVGNDVSIDGGEGNNTLKNGNIEGEYKEIFHPVLPIGGYFTTGFFETESIEGGSNVTINGGANNDNIFSVGGKNIVINSGEGKNVIKLFAGNGITVNSGTGEDIILAEGHPVHAETYSNSDIKGSELFINIAGGQKNYVHISDSFSNVLVNGADLTAGQDLIENDSPYSRILGNKGFDIIHNKGAWTEINGGEDDDMLTNLADHAVITGDGGRDFIQSIDGKDVVIDGGADADLIEVYGDIRAKVSGGDGADTIFLTRISQNIKNQLLSDFGLDLLNSAFSIFEVPMDTGLLSEDFKEQIAAAAGIGGDKLLSRKELIIPKVGKWKLTGAGAKALSRFTGVLSIVQQEIKLAEINNPVSTVNGGKGDDVIVLDGFAPRIVEYSLGDGNDTIHYFATNKAASQRDGNTIAASHLSTLDVKNGASISFVEVNGNNVKLHIGTGSVELVDAAGYMFQVRENGNLTKQLYGTNEDDNLYIDNRSSDIMKIDGMGGNDHIEVGGANNSTINGGAGDDFISSDGANVSIKGGIGKDQIHNYGSNVTINGGADDDYIFNHGSRILFEYNNGDGHDVIEGFGNNTLKIGNGTYSTMASGRDLIVYVGQGSITLKDCRFLKVNIDGTYKEPELPEGIKIENGVLKLSNIFKNNKIDANDFQFPIEVIDAQEAEYGIEIIGKDSLINFKGSAYSDIIRSLPVTNSNANLRALDEVVNLNENNDVSDIVTINGGGGNDTIYGGDRKTVYQYTAGDGNDIIEGFKDNDTLQISDGEYSQKISGNDVIVSVGEGNIILRGAATLANINISGFEKLITQWTLNGTTATYGTAKETLMTINGVKSLDGISLSGNVVVLANSVLNQNTVTVSKGYTLKLADDVPKSSVTNATWSVSDNTATYKTASTSAGYSLSSDGKTINYTNASGGDILVSVTGLKDNAPTSGIELSGKVITLSASVLNQNTVTVSKGYTLKLAADVVKPSATNAAWSVNGTTATYKGNFISAGYSLAADGKSVSYSNESTVNTFTISGLKNGLSVKKGIIAGISIENNVVIVSSEIVGDGEVKITGDEYALEVIPKGLSIKNKVLTVSNQFKDAEINLNRAFESKATKINASAISHNLVITGNNANNYITGGKGADTIYGGSGNDTLTGGAGKDLFVYDSGNDLITDYTAGQDKISAKYTSSIVKDSDVILTTANGNLTIKGAKDKVITFSDGSEKIFYANTSYAPLAKGLTYDAKRTTLTANKNFSGKEIDLSDYLPTANKVNVSAVNQGVNIIGNNASNFITGGKGADTIYGGSGNDTLTGGAGKDLFVYDSGNDLITDYTSGQDKISAKYTSSIVKDSDVILTTANGNLTIKGAKDKVITFSDDSEKIFYGNTSYAPLAKGLTYDAKRTTLTANKNFSGKEIDLSDYLPTANKVNVSAVNQGVNIIGNNASNFITGGKGADTIYGGSGNDTLTGGAGKDLFVYDSGNDLITDYTSGQDKISAKYTSSIVKDSDVILTTANGNLTIKGAKDKVITFSDGSEKIFYANTSYAPLAKGLTYDAKRTTLTANKNFSGKEIDLSDYLPTANKVNVSAVNQGVNIIGNNASNFITGGKGADTIYGGSGNDTLTGGAGKDLFVYDSGNDVITDYTAGQDSIKINGTISNISYKGKNVIFSVGSGTLTVNNAKGKNITVSDFNDFSRLSSKTFDLFCDNHFISDDSVELDSVADVSDTNYSVGQLQYFNDNKQIVTEAIVATASYRK